jgi:hypothetical protein
MNKKHYIKFNQNGLTIEMPIRSWARENTNYFPNFGFTNTTADHPTTHQIKNFCYKELEADLVEDIDTVTVII